MDTGRRLWIAFEAGAVMTSPVVYGSTAIYATGLGRLVSRNVSTGRLLWSSELRGRVVMGSPALSDSLVLVGQEDRFACAYHAADGHEVWCSEFPPGYTYTGHAAPTVANGYVFFSAIPDSSGASMFVHRRAGGRFDLLMEILRDRRTTHYGSQSIESLELRSGKLRWRASIGGGLNPFGHTSGTAVIDAGRVFVVAPLAQSVVALDERSGAVAWVARTVGRIRGPVAAIEGGVLVADATGEAVLLERETGAVRCRIRLPEGVDRAGPLVVDGVAIFAGLSGTVFALPVSAAPNTCPGYWGRNGGPQSRP